MDTADSLLREMVMELPFIEDEYKHNACPYCGAEVGRRGWITGVPQTHRDGCVYLRASQYIKEADATPQD